MSYVRHTEGAVPAKIVFDKDIPLQNIYERNLVAEVSIKEPKVYGSGPLKIIAVDCGMKHNIIRSLVEKGTTVKVVPWNYDFTKELKEEYHGLFISNGPGDPSKLTATIEHLRQAMDVGKPIFGICLGNQLLAHAAGGKTYKLPFGNRGQNQPVVDQITDLAYITPQNHGFAVDPTSLPHNWKPYFTNATDGSNEGILCTNKPFSSVQFHPEAKGGPYDTAFLFDKFLAQVRDFADNKAVSSLSANMRAAHPIKKVVVLGSGGLQIGQVLLAPSPFSSANQSQPG
jgi:carbamoyl-phosphate synthase small subunit